MSSKGIQPEIEARTLRALTEPMSVLPEMGRAKGEDDLYLVVSSSSKKYIVNARDGSCECADATHRDVRCKHQRRVDLKTQRFDTKELEKEFTTAVQDMETKAEQLREKAHEFESKAKELRNALDRLDNIERILEGDAE